MFVPVFGCKLAYFAGPQREAPVRGTMSEKEIGQHSFPRAAAERRAEIIGFADEILKAFSEGEAVVLHYQDIGCRKSKMQFGVAVRTHAIDIPGKERVFRLDCNPIRVLFRKLLYQRVESVNYKDGFHDAAMPPGFEDGAFRVREGFFDLNFWAIKIAKNSDAIRTSFVELGCGNIFCQFFTLPEPQCVNLFWFVYRAHTSDCKEG